MLHPLANGGGAHNQHDKGVYIVQNIIYVTAQKRSDRIVSAPILSRKPKPKSYEPTPTNFSDTRTAGAFQWWGVTTTPSLIGGKRLC